MRLKTSCGCDVNHGDGGRRCRTAAGLGRRSVLSGLGLALAASALGTGAARADAVDSPAAAEDERFMRMAIEEARAADFPFGTVIVKDGAVVMRGRNIGKTTNDPTAHGEMTAIRRFVAVYPAAQLSGTTLYTSGEPCPMCMSAIVWCGIGRVVFAASIEQLATRIGQIMVPCREIAAKTPFRSVQITGGVLSDEAMALFK